MIDYPYIYFWANNKERAKYKGKRCRVLNGGGMSTISIEFEDGHKMATSRRAIRRRREMPADL